MSQAMLDLAKARIADEHREAERRRTSRRLVLERRTARRAQSVVSPTRGSGRLLRGVLAPGSIRRRRGTPAVTAQQGG
jgi:hypothetical protein